MVMYITKYPSLCLNNDPVVHQRASLYVTFILSGILISVSVCAVSAQQLHTGALMAQTQKLLATPCAPLLVWHNPARSDLQPPSVGDK